MDLTKIKQLGERFKDAEFLSKIITSINLPMKSKILDIGTGWGVMSIILALNGYSIITGEPAKWTDWKSNAEQAGVLDKVNYQQLDAQNLPFTDLSIDAIFLLGSFHHVRDKMKAFHEFLRVLKGDGKIVLFDYTNKRIEQIKKHSHHHPPAVKPQEFLENFPVKYKESIDDKNEVFCFIVSKA